MSIHGRLDVPVCGRSADDAHGTNPTAEQMARADDARDMIPIAELLKNSGSASRNSATKRTKVLAVKVLKTNKPTSKTRVRKTRSVQGLQGKNGASDNIELIGSTSLPNKDIVCALSACTEGQTTSTLDRQVTGQTKTGLTMEVLEHKKSSNTNRKGSEEPSPHNSLNMTSTFKQLGRNSVTKPMKESPLAFESTNSHTQKKLDRILEHTPTTTEPSNQEDLSPTVPSHLESMYNGKGTDMHGGLLEKEPSAMIINLSQANRNHDVRTDHATTKVAKSNHVLETAILSSDCPVQQAGGKADEISVLGLQNAGSSQCIIDCSHSRSFSASGSSLPSSLDRSQISDLQFVFAKTSSLWPLVEALEAFKVQPQKPHFFNLLQYSLSQLEGMALGLMVSFNELVKSIGGARIENSMGWFQDMINTLGDLGKNGFNIESLKSILEKMLSIKCKSTTNLEEINKLKARKMAETTSLSQIDARINENDSEIAQLEEKCKRIREKIECIRQDRQKNAKERENGEAEVLNINLEHSRAEEAYGGAVGQFQSILAEHRLHWKQIN